MSYSTNHNILRRQRRTMRRTSRQRYAIVLLSLLVLLSCLCFESVFSFVTTPSRRKFNPPSRLTASAVEAPPSFSLPSLKPWRTSSSTRPKLQHGSYSHRREEWARRYTNVDGLRQTFGSNQNPLWGDLDAPTARRLYKTLLPRALLELYDLGFDAEELAPLAYKARLAAKLYARERCQVPSRVAAQAIDGFRQLAKTGKFQPTGMSYNQIWHKYEDVVVNNEDNQEDLTEEDVTAKICLLILEKSCKTNSMIDKLVLRKGDFLLDEQHEDLAAITEQLERDVRVLLGQQVAEQPKKSISARRVFTLRMVARAKRRLNNKKRRNNQVAHDEHDEPWNHRMEKIHNRKQLWNDRNKRQRQQ